MPDYLGHLFFSGCVSVKNRDYKKEQGKNNDFYHLFSHLVKQEKGIECFSDGHAIGKQQYIYYILQTGAYETIGLKEELCYVGK